MNTKIFEFEGKKYEIRSWLLDDNSTYKVKVFLNDKPANGYFYQVGIEDINDAKSDYLSDNLLDNLIQIAENDVREKKW